MRIISGTARGMNLKSPKGTKIRPTSQKVKAAFFNIIYDRIYGADFLDLFSGSGSMGLEALSRGARRCVFVDKDRESIRLIHENTRLIRMQEQAVVRQGDVCSVLAGLAENGESFDIVYLDPPYLYKHSVILEIFSLLQRSGLLADTGVIGVERPSRDEHGQKHEQVHEHGWELSPFPLKKMKRYGDTALYLFDARI